MKKLLFLLGILFFSVSTFAQHKLKLQGIISVETGAISTSRSLEPPADIRSKFQPENHDGFNLEEKPSVPLFEFSMGIEPIYKISKKLEIGFPIYHSIVTFYPRGTYFKSDNEDYDFLVDRTIGRNVYDWWHTPTDVLEVEQHRKTPFFGISLKTTERINEHSRFYNEDYHFSSWKFQYAFQFHSVETIDLKGIVYPGPGYASTEDNRRDKVNGINHQINISYHLGRTEDGEESDLGLGIVSEFDFRNFFMIAFRIQHSFILINKKKIINDFYYDN